jgi:hypothetical protein
MSLNGTKRTCRGRLTMFAPEGKNGRAARTRALPFLTTAWTQNGPTVVEPHGESVDFGQQS